MTTLRLFLFLIAVLSACGCASVRTVSIVENRALAPVRENKGELVGTVKVEPFREAIVNGKETVYLEGNRLRTQGGGGSKEGKAVAAALAKYLKKKGFLNRPNAQLRIVGDLTLINPGSRELRVLVGLGAGASRLETRAVIYNDDASEHEPWLVIWTTSHSGREPGALFSLAPPPFGPGLLIAGASATAVGFSAVCGLVDQS